MDDYKSHQQLMKIMTAEATGDSWGSCDKAQKRAQNRAPRNTKI